jgi:hypothetical protein
LLISALRQLFPYHAKNQDQKLGLLIFDLKVDGTVQIVKELAEAAGRKDDVIVLGPEGTHYLNFFGRLKVANVEFMTRRLLAGTSQDMGPHNSYWSEARYAMVEAALILLAVTEPVCSFDAATGFMRSWFFNLRSASEAVNQVVNRAQQFLKNLPAKDGSAIRRQVLSAIDQVHLWADLDSRTRSNLQSCLIVATRPLQGVNAGRCFESDGRPQFNPAQIATEGKICVVSINALTEPALTQFFSKLVRHDFFDAVQSRQQGFHRLCGMIADEYPLIAAPEDVEQFATVRSKRCFVMAAAQSIGLNPSLSERARRAALLNFSTIIFLRTRESETGEFACVSLGSRKERINLRPFAEPNDGSLAELWRWKRPPQMWVSQTVCPPGTLGRLEPHQGFVACADGSKTDFPVWFMPWYEDPSFPAPGESPAMPQKSSHFWVDRTSPSHVHALMFRSGRKPLWIPEVVMAAAGLCRPKDANSIPLREAQAFFAQKAAMVPKGLETLPPCWLTALPRILWRLRRPHWTLLPFMIDAVAESEGVLILSFAQEEHVSTPNSISAWDEVRLALNRSLYPSVWRMLKRDHYAHLRAERPDLRSALEGCPPEL